MAQRDPRAGAHPHTPSDSLLDLLLPRLALAGALGVLRAHQGCPGCLDCAGAKRFVRAMRKARGR